jgi:hypothetical protein
MQGKKHHDQHGAKKCPRKVWKSHDITHAGRCKPRLVSCMCMASWKCRTSPKEGKEIMKSGGMLRQLVVCRVRCTEHARVVIAW